MTENAMTEIESLTRDYAKARRELADRVGDLDAETRALQRRRLPGIRNSLARAQDARDALAAAIDGNRQLFKKPKSVTVDGVRVGLAKNKGRIEYDDADKVVAAIRKRLADQAETLIKVEEKPVKAALNNLTAAELKSIGCRVAGAGETVVIKPQDSELDKLVDRLMGEVPEIEEGAE